MIDIKTVQLRLSAILKMANSLHYGQNMIVNLIVDSGDVNETSDGCSEMKQPAYQSTIEGQLRCCDDMANRILSVLNEMQKDQVFVINRLNSVLDDDPADELIDDAKKDDYPTPAEALNRIKRPLPPTSRY